MAGLARTMSEPAQDVFTVYMGEGNRDIRRTADLCNLSPQVVGQMSARYGFPELARDSDSAHVQSMIAATRRKLADSLPSAADTIIAAASNRYGFGGKNVAGNVTVNALRAALATLAMHGISPLTRAQVGLILDTDTANVREVSPDFVASLVSQGDVATLLAIAQGVHRDSEGATITAGGAAVSGIPGEGGAPSDFTSDQPGGRVGSDPSTFALDPSDSEDIEGEYRVLSAVEWDRERTRAAAPAVEDFLDFAFGEQPGDVVEAERRR